MSGIKMSDCKFYVNEEARTVVCVIPNTEDMIGDFINENFDFPELDFTVYGDFRKEIRMPHSFMGKAVCAPEDVWDEKTGRIIAFAKAKNKCYKSFFKRANMFIQLIDKRLNDMITIFNNFGDKLEEKRIALAQDIDNRTKNEGDA